MRLATPTAVAALLLVAISGCAGTPAAKPKPTTFDTTLNVLAPSGADSRYVGTGCDDFRGVSDRPVSSAYSDIKSGAQVVVKNASDKTVAVAYLGAGKLVNGSGTSLVCQYTAALSKLPKSSFYSITVASQSPATVKEAGMKTTTKSGITSNPSITFG